MVELEGKIPIEGYTSWVTEKDNINRNRGTTNLESLVKFYTKMVKQQADAQYIRKQLEDVHHPPNGSKPKEKPSTDKKKAKESASLFGTTVEVSYKNIGGKKRIIKETILHILLSCRASKYLL